MTLVVTHLSKPTERTTPGVTPDINCWLWVAMTSQRGVEWQRPTLVGVLIVGETMPVWGQRA